MTSEIDTRAEALPAAQEFSRHLAYAEASLMLIESLLSMLIERGVLSIAEVTETVEIALDTKRNFVREGRHPQISAVAVGIPNPLARVSTDPP